MTRRGVGAWALLAAGGGALLAGERLAFVPSVEFGFFFKSLGVFLMLAGAIAALVALTWIMIRIAKDGTLS